MLVPVAVLLGIRVAGVSAGFPVAALLTVFPYAVVVALLVMLVALVARLRPLIVVSGLLTLAAVGVLMPRLVPGPNADVAVGDDGGTTLTVAVANLRLGRADAVAVARAIDDHEVDVLVSLEVTESSLQAYEDEGITERLPAIVAAPSRLTSGGSIHSRLPITELEANGRMRRGTTPRARVELPDGTPLELEAVHPLPPVGERWTEAWLDSLASLPAPDDGSLRILAGDFNATHDHAPFRRLLDDGYVDAADAVGSGLTWTFHGLPYGDPVPPVTLDHVLVDPRIEVVDVTVRPLPGSDHRMVVAELRVPSVG